MRARTALAAALGGWLGWRLFGPEIARDYAVPQRRGVRVPGRTVFVGDHEFFLRESGPIDAPTLVLVHGWSFDGELTFYPLMNELSDRYRIVVPDLRNHGHSDWIRGSFDVPQLADELAGTLRAAGVGRSVIMGYSLGGMVVQELARRHPGLVSEMILAGTAAYPVPPPARWFAPLAFWFGRAFARVSTVEGASLSVQAVTLTDSLDPHHARWMYESLRRRDGSLFYEAGKAAYRFDSRDWIGKVRIPATLMVLGEDHIVPSTAQRELAELLPKSRIVELPGVDHGSIYTDTDVYVATIDEVMESHRS